MLRKLIMVGLISLPVVAGATQPSFRSEGLEAGPYIGAEFGSTDLNLSSTAVEGSGSKNEIGFKITGGWQFTPYFAGEIAYYNPGEFKEREGGDALKVTADIFEASIVGSVPLAGDLLGFARAGVAQWNGRIDATIDGESGTLKDDGTDFNWEIGLQYRFNDKFRMRAAFEQTSIDTTLADVLPVTWRVRFYQVAAIYQF